MARIKGVPAAGVTPMTRIAYRLARRRFGRPGNQC